METIPYMPLVSIVMPAYNASRFVEQAVRSVLGQSYENIELIVVDDGSTDDTVNKIGRINDSRLRVISQLNQGACVARNRGLQESKGEFIKFLDADDVLYPDAISLQVKEMLALAKDEEVFGDFDYIDADGNVFRHSTINQEQYEEQNQDEWLLYHWQMVTSCPLHRRELLMRVGGFDVHLQSGHEGMLHFAMSIAGVRFVYRPGAIYQYRIHQDPQRISIKRELSIPNFTDRVFFHDKRLSLIQKKYGSEPNGMTNYLTQSYFVMALSLYAYGADSQGRYCFQRIKEIPHTSKFPRYSSSTRLAKFYILLIRLLGYRKAEKIVKMLVSLLGLNSEENISQSPVLFSTGNK